MRHIWRLVIGACLMALGGSAIGLDELALSLGPLAGPGWRAEGADARLRLGADGALRLELNARGLRLPAPLDGVREATFHCDDGRIAGDQARCEQATLVLSPPPRGVTIPPESVRFAIGRESQSIGLDGLGFARGRVSLELESAAAGWRLELHGKRVSVADVIAASGISVADVAIDTGTGDLQATLSGSDGLDRVAANLRIDQLAFSDAAGERAGEGLALRATAKARKAGAQWRFNIASQAAGGALYLAPLYLEVENEPLRLELEGRYAPKSQRFRLEHIAVLHPGVVDASARVSGRVSADDKLEIDAAAVELPRSPAAPLFQHYVAPFLGALTFADAAVEGEFALSAAWQAQAPSRAAAELFELGVYESQNRLGLRALSGTVHWSQAQAPERTALRWGGGELYGVEFGAAALVGMINERSFRLLEPVTLPLFDGALRISGLELDGLGKPATSWRFKGELEPIALTKVSAALGWPAFEGEVSGTIPTVSYADGVVVAEDGLAVRVFDGQVRIRNLRLRDPFGRVPALSSDIDIEGFSLAALTNAFAFGNIEGRIDGRVHGLVLQDWVPTAFDAAFATPTGDRSRRRISQKAIENLSKIGGASGAVSSIFLGFLKEFSYARLGLSCRLNAGVCEMGGVGQAERGFYIVRGGGLPPWIDVIGYNREVDWVTLVERLKTVTSAEGPVIK